MTAPLPKGFAAGPRCLTATLLLGLLAFAGCCNSGAKRADDSFPFRLARNAEPPAAGAAGPTLRLDFSDDSPGNPIGAFMYFVPLISPDPVSVHESAGNAQRSRVLSVTRRFSSGAFSAECEFTFTGDGSHRNIFDNSEKVRRHERQLRAGEALERALQYISIEGSGRGLIEVEGVVTGRVATVTEVRLRFNAHGGTSPVSIGLADLLYRDNQLCITNEIVARVNALTFRKAEGRPRMGVTVSSVKRKEASDSFWQRLKGGVAGTLANYFLKPLPVEPTGNDAMLDFGAALTGKEAQFTFPRARNLRAASGTP
ncbi:MAG TPA: hypothetical protein VFT34_19150 [Verrucomicrobiae bacterium]|nr:hypothetical protein [Verrucomicrobiae bacterium]